MNIICLANPRRHLQIYWNSSNPIFHSSAFLTVRLGDLIDFICPYYNQNEYSNDYVEYNTLYLVNEYDYYDCNTTNYNPLLICNQPFSNQRFIYTLSISKYLPYPNLPEFNDGQFYYFISTSSGRLSNIDQRYDGLCRTKKMKLIVNVQKSSRYIHEQQRRPTPIIAKRTNLTFIDLNQRFYSFSSARTSRNISLIFVLFVFCLLTKLKT